MKRRAACAFFISALTACTATNPAQFSGHSYEPVVEADAVEMLGRDVPAGHRVIGVVTARCETLNGASGLLEEPCNETIMLHMSRVRAAEHGGTALVDTSCGSKKERTMVSNVDGGGVTQTTRGSIECQSTVARRTGSTAVTGVAKSASATVGRPSGKTRRVEIAGNPIEVGFEGAVGSPRDPNEVGEMDRFPDGYERLGRVLAECVAGCSRSSARRALRKEAARVGALAMAEISCALLGDRWRCEASAVGDALAPADAGARIISDAGSSDAGSSDAGSSSSDAGSSDAGSSDAGPITAPL